MPHFMKIGQLGQKAPDIIWNGPVRIYAKYLPLPKQAAFSSPSRWIFKNVVSKENLYYSSLDKAAHHIRYQELFVVNRYRTYFSLFFFLCSTWTYSALFCSHCWGPGSVKFFLPNIKLSITVFFEFILKRFLYPVPVSLEQWSFVIQV